MFPFEERRYVLEAIRFVDRVAARPQGVGPDALPSAPWATTTQEPVWSVLASDVTEEKAEFCRRQGIEFVVMPPEQLAGFPASHFDPSHLDDSRKRVVVTGCYDWFHSGHVRFFEECSQLGDLYVVVGHDANVRLLKGRRTPVVSRGRAALRRRLVPLCHASARDFRHGMDGCGAGDCAHSPPHVRGERGRRQTREARVLRGARAASTWS